MWSCPGQNEWAGVTSSMCPQGWIYLPHVSSKGHTIKWKLSLDHHYLEDSESASCPPGDSFETLPNVNRALLLDWQQLHDCHNCQETWQFRNIWLLNCTRLQRQMIVIFIYYLSQSGAAVGSMTYSRHWNEAYSVSSGSCSFWWLFGPKKFHIFLILFQNLIIIIIMQMKLGPVLKYQEADSNSRQLDN